MGMQINTNLAANNTYRNLASTQTDMAKSLERLSSGLRINRAADDAAGLAISEGLKSQVGGLTVASRNAQDGISVIQTAEGSLSEVQTILQRVRDLAVQAGNDSNNAKSRDAITTEVKQLTTELTRISASTNFNGTQLLDGSKASLSFQVGANADSSSQIQVSLTGANVKGIAAALTVGSAGAVSAVDTPTAVTGTASFSVTAADGSTSTITTGNLGAAGSMKTVQSVADALNKDTTFKGALTASVDANNKLVVSSNNGGTVVGGATAGTHASAGTGFTLSTAGAAGALDFSTAAGAAAALTAVDTQITAVSTARADMGASQNRFESVIRNLAVSKENLTAAGSRIRDTDMAEEMVKYTRSSILSQAGTAMLAQANQSNQGVLTLLR
ncbi:flagellin [Cryobacterium sp. SO2]|uniref:flagellin N-terminal helical domain-containing protein n=1 Tax=Cryobacterium sp. SO2 TaxID=1897060 RepID=UPI00223CE4F1|nr:flagellin [Cryobacterium sp. SO2]WEO78965.1 flagellin [Cryobacterium sp. SO2]